MSRIYDVTAPDGKTITFRTKNRTYTHAILVRQSYEHALKEATRHYSSDRNNARYFLDRVSGARPAPTGVDPKKWVEMAKEALMGATTVDEYLEAVRTRALARVEQKRQSGGYESWFLEARCGSLALAQRRLQACTSPWYAEAIIVEAKQR